MAYKTAMDRIAETDPDFPEGETSAAFIKGFADRVSDPGIATLSDSEVRNLIASRYMQK